MSKQDLFQYLVPIAEKYHLQLIRRRAGWLDTNQIGRRRMMWLERADPLEAVPFELPPPYSLYDLEPGGPGEVVLVQPVTDEFIDVYTSEVKCLKKTAGGSYERLRALRAALEAVREEIERYQERLDTHLQGTRAVLNAFVHVLAEKVGAPPPDSKHTLYDQRREQLKNERLFGVLETPLDDDQTILEQLDDEEQTILEQLSQEYGLAEMLYHQSQDLWGWFQWAGGDPSVIAHMLREHFLLFDVSKPILESTLNGLRHYHEEAEGTREALKHLDAKRVTYEIIQNAVMLDQEVPGGGEMKAKADLEAENELRSIYTGPAKDYWRYAWEIYGGDSGGSWRNVYTYLKAEQEELGLTSRHTNFNSFKTARKNHPAGRTG